MANALTAWRLGGRDGAWQFFTGWVQAVGQAGAMLAHEEVPPVLMFATLVHGRDWAHRVERYAGDLAIEALTTEAGR